MSFSSFGYIQRDPFAGLKGSAEKGASGSSSSTSLSKMFGVFSANDPKFKDTPLSVSVDPSRGPISILSGQPAPELPTVHDADIGSGSNAGANIQNADTVSAKQGQVSEAKTKFLNAAADVQGPLQAALEQGALDLGFDPQTARNSFMPPPPSSDIIDGALNAGAPGVTTVADVLNTAPKLTAKQEQQLAARVCVLLTPTRDAGGQVVKEAPIPNPLVEQQRLAEVEFLKQALRPVEEQPEFKAIAAVEEKLDAAADKHAVQNPTDQAVVKVAREVGADVSVIDAQKAGPINMIEQQDFRDRLFGVGGVLVAGEISGNLRVSLMSLPAANDPETEEALQRLRKAGQPKNDVPPPQIAMGLAAMPSGPTGGGQLGSMAA